MAVFPSAMRCEGQSPQAESCGIRCIRYLHEKYMGVPLDQQAAQEAVQLVAHDATMSLGDISRFLSQKDGLVCRAYQAKLMALDQAYPSFTAVAQAGGMRYPAGHFVVLEKAGTDYVVVDMPQRMVFAGVAGDAGALGRLERTEELTGAVLLVSSRSQDAPFVELLGGVVDKGVWVLLLLVCICVVVAARFWRKFL